MKGLLVAFCLLAVCFGTGFSLPTPFYNEGVTEKAVSAANPNSFASHFSRGLGSGLGMSMGSNVIGELRNILKTHNTKKLVSMCPDGALCRIQNGDLIIDKRESAVKAVKEDKIEVPLTEIKSSETKSESEREPEEESTEKQIREMDPSLLDPSMQDGSLTQDDMPAGCGCGCG